MRRMVVLAIDGIDWFLMNQWAAEGRMPVLRQVLAESQVLRLGEANRPLPGSVWTDIATGTSAATHGYLYEEEIRAGSYEWHRVDASRVAVPRFYQSLSDSGVRCAVADFPVDQPIDHFNGVQIVDWGTEFKRWRFETRPPALAAQLIKTYGAHPLTNHRTGSELRDLLDLRHKLSAGIDIKRRFAADLLDQRGHDFVFCNFSEVHKAGHFFWRFHDRAHPGFTAAEPGLVDSLRALYEETDAAIGSVLTHLTDQDDLMVMTDRGMYAEYRGDHLVDPILMQLDLAVPRGRRPGGVEKPSLRSRLLGGSNARKGYRYISQKMMPSFVKNALLPMHRAVIGAPPPLDWKKTRVFKLPTVGNSYLRVNLLGRDASGIVTPGAEYEALIADLTAKFSALINPETGERAVENIYYPALHYRGPKAADLPDVAIFWNSNAPINALESGDIKLVAGLQPGPRSGNHRPDGFALFRGPSFSTVRGNQEGDARQIAPAMLKYYGVACPKHYEMEAPEAIFGRLGGAAMLVPPRTP